MPRRASAADPAFAALTVGSLVLGFTVHALAGWHGYFADDESLFWATGVQLVRGEIFPLVGPPISGSPAGLPGPLFYWVCALPAMVSAHPYAQSLFYAATCTPHHPAQKRGEREDAELGERRARSSW